MYAAADLAANPRLREEVSFTVQPDVTKLGDAVHWGGRLMRHGAWGLLISNAIILGGLMTVVVGFVSHRLQRKATPEPELIACEFRE